MEVDETPVPEIQLGTRRMTHLRCIALRCAVDSTRSQSPFYPHTEVVLFRAKEFLAWLKERSPEDGA